MSMKLEICCYSLDDALSAQAAGADRIELCSGRHDGGLTPSYGVLLHAAKLPFSIPIHPIVRPRGGDFYYSEIEFKTMLNDIAFIKAQGLSGVVFGCLCTDGGIDVTNMKKLMKAAQGLSVTFHRAFDLCIDPMLALGQLTDLGVERILTSGQQRSAVDGIELIQQLAQQSTHIKIMPGCGVRANNIKLFIEAKLTEFHSSASKTIPSPMQHHNPNVTMSYPSSDEFLRYQTDIIEIEKMKSAIIAAE